MDPFSKIEPTQIVRCPRAKKESVPDGGYGWVIVAAVGFIGFNSWGINSAYGVFLAFYIKNDTFEGASRLHYALVGGLSVGCCMLIAPWAVVLVRRFGMRCIMLLGAVTQSSSLIASASATRLWHLFLSQGVLFGTGMGLLFLPSYGLVSEWFEGRRATANGIAIAGAGLGGFVWSLSANAMIEKLGLDWTFRILAIVSFVFNTVCALLIKTRYECLGSRQIPFDKALLRQSGFLLILLYSILSMLAYFILIFTLADYGMQMGLGASRASLLPAMFSLGQALGRPFMGYIADRIGCITATTILTYLTGILSLTIWVNAKTFGVMILFSVAGGLVAGVFWVLIGPLLVNTIGLQSLPAGLSIVWLSIVLPSTFSTAMGLEIFIKTGDYTGVQLCTGFVFLSAGCCTHALRASKIVDMDSRREMQEEAGTTTKFRDSSFLYALFRWEQV